MNKLFSIALLGASIFASAQVSVAGKANVLIPTSSATWQNFKDAAGTAVSEKGKNITGFNAGLSLKVDLPTALYVMLSAYVGPVASFNLAKGDDFGTFVQQVKAKDFTIGYQLGVQSEIKKLILSARYEGAFSSDQRKFVNTVAGSDQEIEYDNRPSFFMVGLGYNF